MSIGPGTHTLGPRNGELLVNTGRAGGAAKAGHDLVLEVARWSATLELHDEPSRSSIALSADGGSLRVREGRGGVMALGEGDKDGIEETIDDEVLKRTPIEFRSTEVEPSPGGEELHVRGELELSGQRHPVEFDLSLADDGHLTGGVTIKQSEWGMKPYSTLFGALKVADEVKVTVAASLTG